MSTAYHTVDPPLVYRVVVDPVRHQLEVRMVVHGAAVDGVVHVATPSWVPGDYAFAPYGRDVFALTARDASSGAPLPVARDGWQGYRIDGVLEGVEITYIAACSSVELSEACGVLGDTNGVLTGARYLMVEGLTGPCRVDYELPDGWVIHHPSGAERVAERSWVYPSYELLLDTPVVLGAVIRMERVVLGTPFNVIFLDEAVGAPGDRDRLADDIAAIAAHHHDVFGSFPFDDYAFILASNPNDDWGLEHLTSAMVGTDGDVFTNPESYATAIRACSHELFHAWNVRRLRPAPLERLDLRAGSFTEGLWVAEGFTRYYEFLSCTRTGVYTAVQFFSNLVNYERHLVALPAYRRVSAIDASLATFLNHDDDYAGRANNSIDYYDKGMLIAFELDVALRERGDSLDAAFAQFYAEFATQGAGWTTDQLRTFLDDRHSGLGTEIVKLALSSGGLALNARLTALGFTVEVQDVPRLGLILADDTGPSIASVLDTAPAGHSGLASEDTLTAVDRRPFTPALLSWAATHQTTVTLDVLRGDEPLRVTVQPAPVEQIATLAWSGTASQKAAISEWLWHDFAPSNAEHIPLDFYENFHGKQTVL